MKGIGMFRWLPGLFVLLTAYQSVAEVPIDTLAKLRALPASEAEKQLPVKVEGTVIYFNKENSYIILHDGTAGCCVSLQKPVENLSEIRVGARVLIEGDSCPDSFFPKISNAKATFLGMAKLPEPRQVTGDDMFAFDLDTAWVEVPARVVGVETNGDSHVLVVNIQNKLFRACLPIQADSDQRIASLMQRQVRMRAVVATIFTKDRQMTGRYLMVPSLDQIIPIEKEAIIGSEAPLRRINEMLRSDLDPKTPIRVQGVVTQLSNRGFYLRDDSCSTEVYADETLRYPPGTRVEVEGYASLSSFRPDLRTIRGRALETATAPPTPIKFNPQSANLNEFHNELVVIECKFLAIRVRAREVALLCRAGTFFFEARLPLSEASHLKLNAGDSLRLTGICNVTTTRALPLPDLADGILLYLTGSEAVTVIKKASWWSFARVTFTLGLLFAFFLGVLVWNWMLHRRINTQSKIIARHIGQSLVQDERHRIARELHDTVSQELTGISLQLGNVSAILEEDREKAVENLALARRMLRHCHEETRSSLNDLRNEALLDCGLAAILGEDLSPVVAKSRSTLDLKLEGTPRRLPTVTENHLLRMAHEAVANAARHAHAKTIRVRLQYTDDGVTLEIADDGCGFDPQSPPPIGHFGILGLRERANKIGADFSLESKIGCGTVICVYLDTSAATATESPLPADT